MISLRHGRCLSLAAFLIVMTAACGPAPESQAAAPAQQVVAAQGPAITVYKTPTCGCCTNWVHHLKANGFPVIAHDLPDISGVKAEQGVPRELHSCHTALIGGYVVEGHVPAEVIRKLLHDRPAIAGIAVPGMPMGSPGMEGPYSQSYDVIAFKENGETSVYASR